jgi:hypothetical protein
MATSKSYTVIVDGEEYVVGFDKDELTPIDIVSEITGLSYDEIRSIPVYSH